MTLYRRSLWFILPACSLFAGILCPLGIRVSQGDDVFAFIAQQNGNFDKLDITKGTVTTIKSNGSQYWGLAYNADETTLYGIIASSPSSSSLVTITQDTGVNTVIGPCGVFLTTMTSLADGRLFGVDTTDSLYQINPATGSATLVGATSLPSLIGSWTNSFASDGTKLYYTLGFGGGNSSLYTLNPITGNSTLIGSTGINGVVGSAFAGPTFDSGLLYGFRNNGQTVTINLTTGVATPLNNNGLTDIFGGVGTITTIPEPTTLAILALTGLPLLARRRRAAAPNY